MSTVVTTLTTTIFTNATTSITNFTHADLQAVNDDRARTLIPAMFVMGLLMVIGIVGNSLVCYVFCCRLKSGSQNFLIVCLAVLDLLSCALAIPNEIADMRFYFVYELEATCKIMRFINTFCSIGSIFTLLVIAIDRYRKICKPFHGQMNMTHVRLSLLPIFGGALFFAWPAFAMYGLRTTETGIPGLNGQDCSTPDNISNTMLPLLYNCILFICFIVLAVALIILYTFVLIETKRHHLYMKRNSDFNIPSSGQYNSEESNSIAENSPAPAMAEGLSSNSENVIIKSVTFIYDSDHSEGTTNAATEKAASQTKLMTVSDLVDSDQDHILNHSSAQVVELDFTELPPTRRISCTGVPYTDPSQVDFHGSSTTSLVEKLPDSGSSSGIRRTVNFSENVSVAKQQSIKNRQRIKSKTTMIAFMVTLVFILSFLPHLCLQVTKLLNKGFDYNLRESALVAYNIFLRSYFINSVSNPFIYGYLNVHFSKEVRHFVKRLCRKV